MITGSSLIFKGTIPVELKLLTTKRRAIANTAKIDAKN